MTRQCLIYRISCTLTGDAYVGSTIARASRRAHHFSQLRHGRHHCAHLQAAWKKYGEAVFIFEELHVFVPTSRRHRLAVEGDWISAFATYNTLVPSERAGVFIASAESRQRRRDSTRQKMSDDPAFREKLVARGLALGENAKSPEGRARTGAHAKRRWAEPMERAKLAKGLENRWADPEARTHHAATMRELRSTEAERKRQSDALKAAWADPTSGFRNRSNGRWADPEAKARQAAKLRAAHARRKANAQPS